MDSLPAPFPTATSCSCLCVSSDFTAFLKNLLIVGCPAIIVNRFNKINLFALLLALKSTSLGSLPITIVPAYLSLKIHVIAIFRQE
ncbi:hypothetical protein AWRI1631_31360 [Saccharomyces cerevisiae AWRI1631]|uniref:Uncharacterized protein n=1 Tax=Saccharomyces cerevisiae (strain AWRI1631) TaxID=545124 RepID=B5VF21_YEAS6|nr:hypothetical protein AWRI1631_31360 [Saccharomyces cerevisiae AWRI1631]